MLEAESLHSLFWSDLGHLCSSSTSVWCQEDVHTNGSVLLRDKKKLFEPNFILPVLCLVPCPGFKSAFNFFAFSFSPSLSWSPFLLLFLLRQGKALGKAWCRKNYFSLFERLFLSSLPFSTQHLLLRPPGMGLWATRCSSRCWALKEVKHGCATSNICKHMEHSSLFWVWISPRTMTTRMVSNPQTCAWPSLHCQPSTGMRGSMYWGSVWGKKTLQPSSGLWLMLAAHGTVTSTLLCRHTITQSPFSSGVMDQLNPCTKFTVWWSAAKGSFWHYSPPTLQALEVEDNPSSWPPPFQC